jgi:HD-GYP domain-containing protein (c-di-GMP phosphodiesterase class II)
MFDQSAESRPGKVYAALSDRCTELSIPLWHLDGHGRVLASPAVVLADVSVEAIVAGACSAMASNHFDPAELSPGNWLVPLESRDGSRRLAIYAALVRGQDATQVLHTQKILRWSHDEFCRQHQDDHTLDQFSEKLAQAYEETNLLYRMASLLNCANEPAKTLEIIASQLQEVLPFKWLAIRFANLQQAVPELDGRTIFSGRPPCDTERIVTLSNDLLTLQAGREWKKLLSPKRDALAAAVGAEVLAEPITHDQRTIGVLLAGNKSGPDPELSSFEMQFLDATADFLGVFHENLARFVEQKNLFMGTLRALTASIDAKDRYTCGHSERVGLMASKMAEALGLDQRMIEQYRIAGIVHDVGKIGVPETVLCKPGRLTDPEFAQIKLHPEIGHNILRDIRALDTVLPGVLWHHERWDGNGYPHKLAGEQIPVLARVLALADTFDAMSSNRAYRTALPREKVLEEIARCGGSQFDPQLAPIFVRLDFTEFDQALETHKIREQRAA